ncbi:hypothetical protein SFRURICE_003502 [Spodoptera frugiperda]|nr:hypothetical protein SFRURICE_003502 [Spodoptera frugiperda]
MHFWTSLTKIQFNSILQRTPSLGTRSDCPATVLGIYLVKIRTGESDERLASKFNMSRRTFERKLQTARQCLTMRNMMTDFKITAAIINAIRHPFEDSAYVDQFISIINDRMGRENELAQFVIENNMNRQRVAFLPLDGNNPDYRDFPQMTLEDLTLFTLGSYHLRLARSYCNEHMRPNGVYLIELYRQRELLNNKILLRGRIQSRHVRARQYYTYMSENSS